jgi:hypothetical protein
MDVWRINLLNEINDDIDKIMHAEFAPKKKGGAEPVLEEVSEVIYEHVTSMNVSITYFEWNPNSQNDPFVVYDLITDGNLVICLCLGDYRMVRNIERYGIKNYAKLVCDDLLIPAMEKSMHETIDIKNFR